MRAVLVMEPVAEAEAEAEAEVVLVDDLVEETAEVADG